MKWFKKLSKYLIIAFGILGASIILTSCRSRNTASSGLIHPHHFTIGMSAATYPYAGKTKNGRLIGFEVDLSKDIAYKMHLKPKFVITKWQGLIAGLGTKKYDAIFNNISVTKQRKKHFLYASPYMYSYNSIVEPKDGHITNLKQIKGKKVADQAGTDYSLLAQKWHAKFLPVEGDELLPYLKERRAKATLSAVPNWYGDEKNHNVRGLKMVKIPTSEKKPGIIAPLLNKKSPALRKKINKAIKELRNDGTLKKLSIKYFGHDLTVKE